MIYIYSALGGSYISADSCKVGAMDVRDLVTELIKLTRKFAYIGVPERSLLRFATLV